MNKKEIFLVGLVAVLAGLYVFYFSGWFAPKTIEIQHTVRPYRESWGGGRQNNASDRTTHVISFVMNREWELDEVKVVAASEYQTNKQALPLWHMVTDEKPRATKAFVYGGPMPGMHPSVAGIAPERIEAGVAYTLVVRSGKRIGEHDFQVARTIAR